MDSNRCNELLSRISEGDMSALSELFESNSRFVFSTAFSIVKDWQLAEDITQDVFINIKIHADQFRCKENPIGWLFVITRNTARNALKSKYYRSGQSIYIDSDSTKENNFEDSIVLKNALGILPRLERQIVILYLADGISQKDIAKLLKLPATTVNWKYRSALKKLRKFFMEGDHTHE